MSFASQRQDYEALLRELAQESHRQLLDRLGDCEPVFREFRTWRAVVAFYRQLGTNAERTDPILLPILASFAQDRDPRWVTVLTAIFWPTLVAAHGWRRSLSRDAEDLLTDIHWAFLKTIHLFQPSSRTGDFHRVITNLVTHRLWDIRGPALRAQKLSRSLDRWLEEQKPAKADIADLHDGRKETEERLDKEVLLRRLRRHRTEGGLPEVTFLLLVGTLIYKRPLKECAAEVGIGYEAAKKRCQRAQVALRLVEGKGEKRMSPDSASGGLSKVEGHQ